MDKLSKKSEVRSKPNEDWKNDTSNELFEALLSLESVEEMQAFCRDLLTEKEIEEFSGRFSVAKALARGASQRQVSAKTGVSIATVTRVNKWLHRGMNGYKTALERMKLI